MHGLHRNGHPVFMVPGGVPIRKCALERKVWSCGACDDYPCGNLGFITDHCPDALERLEAVRISSKGPEHQVEPVQPPPFPPS
jgi:hypothetical protein